MNKIDKQIKKLKKEMRDYIKYCLIFDIDEKTKERKINMYLDNLSYLLKQRLKQY
jgi:predicted nucleotide-binding protein (sugar kinase/HSP70/actin superfamily)